MSILDKAGILKVGNNKPTLRHEMEEIMNFLARKR